MTVFKFVRGLIGLPGVTAGSTVLTLPGRVSPSCSFVSMKA